MAISLDGYVAARDRSDLSWINDAMAKGEDYGFAAMTERTGAYIVGANTYRETMRGRGPGPGSAPTFVVTHDKAPGKSSATLEFYSGDLKALVAKAKSRTDKDIFLFGGAALATQFLAGDLLDELSLAVIPVLLGDGVPFFGRLPGRKRLALIGVKAFPSGIVILNYRVGGEAPAPRTRSRRIRT
jgi:dihydrofolate reductase